MSISSRLGKFRGERLFVGVAGVGLLAIKRRFGVGVPGESSAIRRRFGVVDERKAFIKDAGGVGMITRTLSSTRLLVLERVNGVSGRSDMLESGNRSVRLELELGGVAAPQTRSAGIC